MGQRGWIFFTSLARPIHKSFICLYVSKLAVAFNTRPFIGSHECVRQVNFRFSRSTRFAEKVKCISTKTRVETLIIIIKWETGTLSIAKLIWLKKNFFIICCDPVGICERTVYRLRAQVPSAYFILTTYSQKRAKTFYYFF